MSEKKELSMDELGEVLGGVGSRKKYRIVKFKCRNCINQQTREVYGDKIDYPECCGKKMWLIDVSDWIYR